MSDRHRSFVANSAHRTEANAPLVSVLMTTYKHEPYIGQAIESVLAQECDFPFELIIGEDCSQDRTREIARSFSEQHPNAVRLICGDTNIGLARNTKRTFDACRGLFIAFCEGDDWWVDKHKLQKQIEKFTEQQVGMVHCNYAVAKPSPGGAWKLSKGVLTNYSDEHLRGDNLFSIYHRTLVPRLSASVFRRELLSRHYESKLGSLDYVTTDVPMIVFAAAESEIEYVADVGMAWRHTPNSVTRSGPRKNLGYLQGGRRIFADIAELYGHRNDFDPKASAWISAMEARAAFRLNDADAFHSAMERLRKLDPKATNALPLRLRQALLKFPPLARAANRLLDAR